MNLAPLATAPLAIKIHLATVVPSFILGSWLIFRSTKGARPHRLLGALYMTLMTITAITALFIHSLHPGHFSWLHLFVPLTLGSVAAAIWRIRRHDIKAIAGPFWVSILVD